MSLVRDCDGLRDRCADHGECRRGIMVVSLRRGLAAFGQPRLDKALDLLTREFALMMRHLGG